METRKLTVGLAAFGGLVIVYVIYASLMRTPQINDREMEASKGLSEVISRSEEMGIVDEKTKVNPGEAIFYDRDETGHVVRKWGFKDMYMSQDERVWEVVDPFMHMFLPTLTCRITADKGVIRLNSQQTSPFPEDATFSGNVVILVEPEPGSDQPASRTELDDIVFLSTKSLFSSKGKIRFESERVTLVGTGLECVYNDHLRRIEYFWLRDLESLNVLIPEESGFHGTDEQLIADSNEAVENPVDPNDTPTFSVDRALITQYYRCLVRGNALVQSPKQMIYAQETIDLYDIPWPLPGHDLASDVNALTDANEPNTETVVPVPETKPYVNMAITCDRGILVAPPDVNMLAVDPCGIAGLRSRWADGQDPNGLLEDQALFHVRDVRHSVLHRDLAASGPLEFTFYMDPSKLKDLNLDPGIVPIKITAQEQARYDAKDNRILFLGDSVCSLLREDPNEVEQFFLEAPRLTIELASQENDKDMMAMASVDDVEHVRADGGIVRLRVLSSARSAPDGVDSNLTIVGGAEMECRECDYDPARQTFVALGPGMILFKNSSSPTDTDPNSEDEPFVASLRDFDNLVYYVEDKRIVAEGNAQQMRFDYVPVIEGRSGQHMKAQANHIEITLLPDNAGKMELETVMAKGNVFYDDSDHQLAAKGLFYNHRSQQMEMWGDVNEPCFANGLPATNIKFNLRTGDFKTQIDGPGIIAPQK